VENSANIEAQQKTKRERIQKKHQNIKTSTHSTHAKMEMKSENAVPMFVVNNKCFLLLVSGMMSVFESVWRDRKEAWCNKKPTTRFAKFSHVERGARQFASHTHTFGCVAITHMHVCWIGIVLLSWWKSVDAQVTTNALIYGARGTSANVGSEVVMSEGFE
jgi:hypothetical protein